MTLALTPRQYPLSAEQALQALKDDLGENYTAPTDNETLLRALQRDMVVVGETMHPRPWATAARLITMNTEYEITDGLKARIDRKLKALKREQQQADAAAGIEDAVKALEGEDEAERWLELHASGSMDTRGVF